MQTKNIVIEYFDDTVLKFSIHLSSLYWLLVHQPGFVRKNCIISICIKKKTCKDIIVLTDLGLHSRDLSYKIAGSYKDAR